MENVLDRRGDSSGGDINLTVNLDGKTVCKTVVKKNNESIRMTGKKLSCRFKELIWNYGSAASANTKSVIITIDDVTYSGTLTAK